MTSKPKEHTLYDPLIRGGIADGWLLARISDQSFGKKCADIIGCAPNGVGALVEVKVVDRFLEDTFPWNLFEAHQINWLGSYVSVGAYALTPLYNYKSETMRVYRIKAEPPYAYYDLTLRKDGSWVGWNQMLDRRHANLQP